MVKPDRPVAMVTVDQMVRDPAVIRRRIQGMLDQRSVAEALGLGMASASPLTTRQRWRRWRRNWLAARREAFALRVAPWLEREEEW